MCSPPILMKLYSLVISISPPFAPSFSSLSHTALQMFGSSTSFPSCSKFHKKGYTQPHCLSFLFSPAFCYNRPPDLFYTG